MSDYEQKLLNLLEVKASERTAEQIELISTLKEFIKEAKHKAEREEAKAERTEKDKTDTMIQNYHDATDRKVKESLRDKLRYRGVSLGDDSFWSKLP